MLNQLHILVLEDDPFDAELSIAMLEEAGYQCQWIRIETREEFLDHLNDLNYDLILADYSLPSFDGLTALRLMLERDINLPFILVSGTLGEEIAIESLKAGATDYVLKNHLSRLGPVVRRALQEQREHRQRQQAEAALRASEARYRAIVEDQTELICRFLPDGQLTFVNEAYCRYFDQERTSLLYRTFNSFILNEDQPKVQEHLASLSSENQLATYECRVMKPDDQTIRWQQWTHRMILDEVGNFIEFQGVGRDITERKQLEKQLLQSQKMEAIGRLAGGVAHDFNNLLTIIMGYGEFLLARHPDEEDPIRQDIEQIKRAGEQATMLTRQLLAFSRKQSRKAQIINLNIIISNVEKMLNRLISEDIHLITLLDSELSLVKADPGQIEQILMNLVVNARDAMPWGGELTLKTTNTIVNEAQARQNIDLAAGSYAVLTVKDTGVGMDAITQTRIFEPFFTTKTMDKGTGLGLSTVYGIVRQSGGHISVSSKPEQGTTFNLYFPVAKATAKIKLNQSYPPSLTGSETILLVEDEAGVRLVVREFLQKSGYLVKEAANGTEALKFCQQYSKPIHLLVTDVVMPDMSGRQLAEAVKEIRPDIRVIYISGYPDEIIDNHGLLKPGVVLLQKPFTMEALTRKVRAVLDTSPKNPHKQIEQ